MRRSYKYGSEGPLVSMTEGFRRDILKQGYERNSANNLVGVWNDFNEWMLERKLQPTDLSKVQILKFLRSRKQRKYINWLSPKCMQPMIAFLQRQGHISEVPQSTEASALSLVLNEYREYLKSERRISDHWVKVRIKIAREFMLDTTGSELNWDRLRPDSVRQFILSKSKTYSGASVRGFAGSLRCFLKWLHMRGRVEMKLLFAIPSVSARRSRLPSAIAEAEVERLFNSCDRRTHTGRRAYAILLLMIRLGLRRGEVAALQFDHIDWRSGEIKICSKGSENKLPLPEEVGRALSSYITQSRPKHPSMNILLRQRAPWGPITSAGVQHILSAMCRRLGMKAIGAHRLRHTAATRMLQSGSSISEIAQVLRHSNAATTAIYAKVDRQSLRDLASPWPGSML